MQTSELVFAISVDFKQLVDEDKKGLICLKNVTETLCKRYTNAPVNSNDAYVYVKCLQNKHSVDKAIVDIDEIPNTLNDAVSKKFINFSKIIFLKIFFCSIKFGSKETNPRMDLLKENYPNDFFILNEPIEYIKQSTSTNTAYINSLKDKVENLDKNADLNALHDELSGRLPDLLTEIFDKYSSLESILYVVTTHNKPPLRLIALMRLFKELKQIKLPLDVKLPSAFKTDAYDLLTVEAFKTNRTIDFYIHVPLVMAKNFKIIKIFPVPTLHAKSNVFTYKAIPEREFLTDDTDVAVISTKDHCKKFDSTFLCDDQWNFEFHNDECVSQALNNSVPKNCLTRAFSLDSPLFLRISRGNFLVVTTTPIACRVIENDGKIETITLNNNDILVLKNSRFDCGTHELSTISNYLNISALTQTLDFSPSINFEDLSDLATRLNSLSKNKKFDNDFSSLDKFSEDLVHELEQIKNEKIEKFDMILPFIITLIILLFFALFCWILTPYVKRKIYAEIELSALQSASVREQASAPKAV